MIIALNVAAIVKCTDFLPGSCNFSVIVILARAFELQDKSKNPLSHSVMSFNGEIIALIIGSFARYASSDKTFIRRGDSRYS